MVQTSEKGSRTAFYQFARRVATLFCAVFSPCRLEDPGAFRRPAPFILIANHQSMLDPVLLAVKAKEHEIRFIGKRELTRFRLLKWMFARLHMIAVSRHMTDLSAMRAAGEALRAGQVLGIFPEGGRRRGQPMETVESGVSFLALRSGAPLLPVLFLGRPGLFRRTRMVVGEPIPYEDLRAQGLDKRSGDLLNARIREVYRDMAEKHKTNTKPRSPGGKERIESAREAVRTGCR